MKGSTVFIIAGGALLLMLLSNSASAADLSYLSDKYGADNVARLQRAANALAAQGISGDTLKYCLAQVLVETGIFTPNDGNYYATDTRNNFSGITNGNGTYRVYNNANDWAADYVRVLNLSPSYPIDAVSIDDFNNRLKSNGYYTDSQTTYDNNLNYYYNLLQ